MTDTSTTCGVFRTTWCTILGLLVTSLHSTTTVICLLATLYWAGLRYCMGREGIRSFGLRNRILYILLLHCPDKKDYEWIVLIVF